jgi:hypothetical protein
MVCLTVAGCSKEMKRGDFIARVDNAVLTSDDLPSTGDSLGTPRTLSRHYVNEWIVRELLFQEAERRGLTAKEDFRRQLQETTRELAIAALLQAELYESMDTTSVREEAIANYYTQNKETFALRQDLAYVSYVVFSTREAANAFRSRVLRGTPWEEVLARVSADTAESARPVRIVSRQYFTSATLFPEELWRLARSLNREEPSFPLKIPSGTCVVRLHQLYRQGEFAPLEYAHDEVRARILMDLRREKYESLVASLREKGRVDIRLERLEQTRSSESR